MVCIDTTAHDKFPIFHCFSVCLSNMSEMEMFIFQFSSGHFG